MFHFQAVPVLPLSLIKKRHKHNKEGKAFLLVELRITIQKYSNIAFVYTCVITHVDSSLKGAKNTHSEKRLPLQQMLPPKVFTHL
jgi:hypothetical protein